MRTPTPTINHDLDKLIAQAHLQRSAAIGAMLVDAGVAIANAVRHVFSTARARNVAGARPA